MQYMTLTSIDTNNLMEEVKVAIYDDWRPQGGVGTGGSSGEPQYAQALVKD